MANPKTIILFFLIIFLSGASGVLSQIATNSSTPVISEISLEDLDIGKVGFLPDSPFYFLKEWRRAFRRIFTLDPVRKVETEIGFLNERAAEIKELEGVEDGAEAIRRALFSYEENAERLRSRMGFLKETSENPGVDLLLDELSDRAIKHQKLFDEIKLKFGDRQDIVDGIEGVRRVVNLTLADIPQRLDSVENFKARLRRVIESQKASNFRELRAVEIIIPLEEKLSGEAKIEIGKLREELLIKFSARFRDLDLDDLVRSLVERVPGDMELRLEVLDEARERLEEQELKAKINLVRQAVLERLTGSEINEARVRDLIDDAEEVINELEAKISSGEYLVSQSVEEALERSVFNFDQAKNFFEAGQYGAAFGQASSALAIAKSALGQLRSSVKDFEEDLLNLRRRFDRIDLPEKEEEIGDLEKLLIDIRQLTENRASTDRIQDAFKQAVSALVGLEQMMSDLNGKQNGEKNGEVGDSEEPVLEESGPRDWKVEIRGDGYVPNNLEIKRGDSVTWVNLSQRPSWPASAAHPTHAVYPGSDIRKCGTSERASIFDACRGLEKNESYTFRFKEAGEWQYHDHLAPSITGIIIVK